MGKKGPTRHLKRHMSPAFWPIHRKEAAWAVRTGPGPHGAKVSTPLLVLIRDTLKYAQTAKEARMLIKEGKVVVDGKIRRSEKYPAGLMDVVWLPKANETYRVMPKHGGRFILHPINREEAEYKLCRIIGKKTTDGGNTQLNLHDSRNIQLEDGGSQYSVNDILKIKLPEQEILEKIDFKPGVKAIITGGRSQGTSGILIGLGSEPGKKRTATVRTDKDEDVRTLASYVFAVGTETPIISLPSDE